MIVHPGKDMTGIFELCNPHLLSGDMLASHLQCRFSMTSANLTKSQTLELFCLNISPKEQRVHRDNRRGVLLKRLQRSSLKQDFQEKVKILNSNDFKPHMKEQENKRVSSGLTGPEQKRSKICWPWRNFIRLNPPPPHRKTKNLEVYKPALSCDFGFEGYCLENVSNNIIW